MPVWTSADGSKWNRVGTMPDVLATSAMQLPTGWVAVGGLDIGTGCATIGPTIGLTWTSIDGRAWKRLPDDRSGVISALVRRGDTLIGLGQRTVENAPQAGAVWTMRVGVPPNVAPSTPRASRTTPAAAADAAATTESRAHLLACPPQVPSPSRPLCRAAPRSSRPGVVYAFQFTSVAVWVAFAAMYFQELGVSLGTIGLLAAIPSAVAIFAAPAWGLVADRLGDVRPPYLAGALWAAAFGLVLADRAVRCRGSRSPSALLAVGLVRPHAARRRPHDPAPLARPGAVRPGAGLGLDRVHGHDRRPRARLIPIVGLSAAFVVYAVAMALGGVSAALLLGKAERGLRVAGIGPLAGLGLLRLPGARAVLRRLVRSPGRRTRPRSRCSRCASSTSAATRASSASAGR